MKINKLVLLTALATAGSVNAASFSYSPYIFDDQTTYQALLSSCGSSSNIGMSSIFGSSADYSKSYPIMGQLHSEIETMPGISSNTLKYSSSRFQKAKGLKNNVFGYTYDIGSMYKRNNAYISSTQALYDSAMEKYQESFNQLQKESDAVTSMAVGDVLDNMQPSSDSEYESGRNDYLLWSTCVGWWVAGMPYYMTSQEKEEHKSRPNGWKDGQLTNSKYQFPSTNINGLKLSDKSYIYDRSAYNSYVTQDENEEELSSESSENSGTQNAESSSSEWWEGEVDNSNSNIESSENTKNNWWE